ncbi:MAG: hypothetical protein IH920_01970, partial [Chloroflexi bacterium]|nr:hypothetical protein [Chloroflexota bacterium]
MFILLAKYPDYAYLPGAHLIDAGSQPDHHDQAHHQECQDEPQASEAKKKTSPGMDLSSLPGQKKFTVDPLIVVMEEKVPLYKGPGPQFKRIAFAYRDQKFKLLRTVKGSEPNLSWHLIKDRNEQSFFISAASTRVIKKKVTTSRKIVLKSKSGTDVVRPHGIF